MKNLNFKLSVTAAMTLLVVATRAQADSPIVSLITPNTSLLKSGNWSGSPGNPPTAGQTGTIAEGAANNPLGWNSNTNPGTTEIGDLDFISGATNLVVGDYTTKSTNVAVNIQLGGSTLNSVANTVIANSSGNTVVFENDVAPSGDLLTESALTTLTLVNSANVIQATSGSNIIIDNVIIGTSEALTFQGGGSSSATGATLELGAGSANDVVGGVGANVPVKANGGSFSGTAVAQTSDKNSFTGGLTVGNSDGTQAGIVKVDGGNALPTTGAVTVNTNSQLLLNGGATYGGSAQTVNLNGTGTAGSANGALATGSADTSTLQATVNLASTSAVSVNGTSVLSVTGQITGGGQLQSIGTGTLNLNHANIYSGGTNVSAGSVVSGSGTALGSGAVTVSGGALSSSISSTTSVGGTLSMTSGSIALSSMAAPTLTLASGQNFSMNGGTLSLSYSLGNIGSIASLGSSSFTISSGTLNLNNSFTGEYGSSYNVLTGFGSSSVSGLSITGYDSTDYTANLSSGGVLSFSAVASAPEPSTWALLLGSVASLIGFQNLRRRNHIG